MSEEIDLIVAEDQRRAEEIIDALKREGIDQVSWWPDRHCFFGGGRDYWVTTFHICVPEEDFAQAEHVLRASGLQPSSAKDRAIHVSGGAQETHVAHFHARHENGRVELDWEARYGDKLRWRVLRSELGFAADAEPPSSNGQVLVAEGMQTHLVDPGLDPDRHFYYTVFSQEPDRTWCKQVEVKLRPHDLLGWIHPHRHEGQDAQASRATSAAPSRLQQMPLPEDRHPSAQMSASTDRPDPARTTDALWPAAAPPDEQPQPGSVSAPSASTAPSPPPGADSTSQV